MPHLILEYSSNIAEHTANELLLAAHDAMMESGLFQMKDIKARAYRAEVFLVGEREKDGSFVHLSVAIKAGRTPEQKENLGKSLLDHLKSPLSQTDQITVEIRELNDVYYKYMRL